MVPRERLSRFLSFLLRHRPPDYPLGFDESGFIPLEELMETVNARFPDAEKTDVLNVIEDSDKMRFELLDGKVRATYGHSFPVKLEHKDIPPPLHLYHGIARDLAPSLLEQGLKPRGRQYVHLSLSVEEALAVGKNRDPSPVILVIQAQAADAEGIRFYHSGPLFLAQEIPARFLALWDQGHA